MIAVDTSALLAILLGEPERARCQAALDAADEIVISAGTLIEARMVARGKGGDPMVALLDALIEQTSITIVAVSEDHAKLAHAGFTQFGKGNRHPARLNFGDLFAYALAKSNNAPLLFKGDDFAATDVRSAMQI